MRGSWRAVVLAVAVLATLAAIDCSAAWADGDPASDVLLSQVSFLPADAGFSTAQQARLNALLHAAARDGYPVRVAVIPSAYDLGSITALWRKPETYARFLGAELSLVYKHPLVVVMPDGVGLNWPGHSVASAHGEVADVGVGSGAMGLLGGAQTAVRQLLSAAGVHVPSSGRATDAASASGPSASVPARQGGRSSAHSAHLPAPDRPRRPPRHRHAVPRGHRDRGRNHCRGPRVPALLGDHRNRSRIQPHARSRPAGARCDPPPARLVR